MNQGKLVFAQLMQHLPLTTFQRCVDRYQGHHKVKSFFLPGSFSLSAKTGFDVAQAFAVGQLRESHATTLILAGEVLGFVMTAITFDTPTEGVHGQMLHHL